MPHRISQGSQLLNGAAAAEEAAEATAAEPDAPQPRKGQQAQRRDVLLGLLAVTLIAGGTLVVVVVSVPATALVGHPPDERLVA